MLCFSFKIPYYFALKGIVSWKRYFLKISFLLSKFFAVLYIFIVLFLKIVLVILKRNTFKKSAIWHVQFGGFFPLSSKRRPWRNWQMTEEKIVRSFSEKIFQHYGGWHHYWCNCTVTFVIKFSKKKIFKNLKTIRTCAGCTNLFF